MRGQRFSNDLYSSTTDTDSLEVNKKFDFWCGVRVFYSKYGGEPGATYEIRCRDRNEESETHKESGTAKGGRDMFFESRQYFRRDAIFMGPLYMLYRIQFYGL